MITVAYVIGALVLVAAPIVLLTWWVVAAAERAIEKDNQNNIDKRK